jgi:hypothetical protein
MQQHIKRINAHGRASHKVTSGAESPGEPRQVSLSRHHRRCQHRRPPKGEPSKEIHVLLSSELNPLSSHEEAVLPRTPHIDQKVEQVQMGPLQWALKIL